MPTPIALSRSRRTSSEKSPVSPRRSKSPSPALTRKEELQRPGALLLVLIFLSLQSITLLALVDALPILKSPTALAAFGVTCLAGIAVASKVAFKWCGCTFSASAIFFSIVTWSAAVDLLLALALIGATQLGQFYVMNGEEYFKSSCALRAASTLALPAALPPCPAAMLCARVHTQSCCVRVHVHMHVVALLNALGLRRAPTLQGASGL